MTLTRLDRAPDVIAAAFAAGANSVNGPNLASENPTAGQAAARAEALAQAKAQAEAYAAGLGMRVARILRVSERGVSTRPEVYVAHLRVSEAASAPPPPAPPRVSLATGEMRRDVTVWIDYALVPK